jgi:hypothetical protein
MDKTRSSLRSRLTSSIETVLKPGMTRFKGNYILRQRTRLRNSWSRPKTRLASCPEAATAAPRNVRS